MQGKSVSLMLMLCVIVLIPVCVISLYFGVYYHAGPQALAALEGTDTVAVTQVGKGWFFDGESDDTVFVFYPGAKVESVAYAQLMLRIAETGADCYLCEMPLNFALFDKYAGKKLIQKYGSGYDNRYIGGHSLGGVAASMICGPDSDWDGLILIASYPVNDPGIPVLSIYGSEDKVLNMEAYTRAKHDGIFPEQTAETVIEGGNHAGFGDYGAQKGDGTATITPDDQQRQTAEVIKAFLMR